jgi:hypothetical protein
MITEFNIYQAQSKGKEPDVAYLWSLSYQAYPALINYEISKYGKDYMNYYYPKQKLIYLANKEENYTWQSYNMARCNGYDEIAKHTNLLHEYPISLFKIYYTHRNLNF